MQSDNSERSQISPWVDWGLLFLIAALFLRIGWRRWTHVMIDFGRELYVPWRLAEGDVLFRDIAYFNGPLSPHLNSVVFRIFGTSYTSLILFNILLLAITVWLLYRLMTALGSRLSATVGGVLFLIIFALADLTRAGNYNFITPYSHEMTHGSLLGLVVLTALFAYVRRPSSWRLVLIGGLLGTVFLTKAEFFLAAVAAVSTVVLLEMWQGDRGNKGLLDRAKPLVLGFMLPPLIAWFLMLGSLSPGAALRGVLGPWPYLFLQELGELRFYRKGMGTDAPVEHLRRMAIWIGLYAAMLVPPFLAALRTSPRSSSRRWVAGAISLWAGLLFVVLAPRFNPTDLPRPLPVILLVALVIALARQLRRPRDGSADWRPTAGIAFNVYALLLLAKMAFYPRFHNYGFALAMPAAMFLVVLLLDGLPRWIDRRGGYGPAFRLSALVFLVLVAVVFSWPSVIVFREKSLPFGHGADMFKIQDRFVVMQRLLERLPEVIEPDETLIVIPEGVMLNYQLRLENPTPHINFMPPELIMFGEDAIVASLMENPPDVIVLVKRQTMEYGFETIGNGYGERLMSWVGAHYPIVETVEDPDLWGANFGMALILRGPVEETDAPPGL